MAKTIHIKGYYGDEYGKSHEGTASVSLIIHGAAETLSIGFEGRYQADIPFRPVEALAAEAYRAAAASGKAEERRIVLRGYYTDGRVRLSQGDTTVWARANNRIVMLTVEFDRRGQISVPYAPVANAAASERRGRV